MKAALNKLPVLAAVTGLALPQSADAGELCSASMSVQERVDAIVGADERLGALQEAGFVKLHETDPGKANGKLVVYVKDMKHGEPEFEHWKLAAVQACTNFVGVEGWAGADVDKQRGRQILNGEEDLVKGLIADESWQVVPLEDPELQIKGLAATWMALYFIAKKAEIINEKCAEVSDSLSTYDCPSDLDIANENVQHALDNVASGLDDELGLSVSEAHVLLGTQDPVTVSSANQILISSLKTILGEVSLARSEAAVQRMTDAIDAADAHTSTVVFGSGHAEELIEGFNQAGYAVLKL